MIAVFWRWWPVTVTLMVFWIVMSALIRIMADPFSPLLCSLIEYNPPAFFSDKKFDRMVEYYTRPLSVPFLFHASGGSSWPSSQINIKMYSSKSEVILWSDKDNGVPPLHALIEPLYPLMATLAPCPKHCLCSQHTRDHENITKAHEKKTITHKNTRKQKQI